MENKIYPFTKDDVQDIVNIEKAKHILEFLANCKLVLKRYTKLQKRWSNANNIIKYSS